MKLTPTFSLLMVDASKEIAFHVLEISVDRAAELLDQFGVESHIGTRGLANILSNMLDMDIDHHFRRVSLFPGEQGVTAIYDGTTKLTPKHHTLPEGSELRFFHFQVTDRVVNMLPVPQMNHMSLEEKDLETIGNRHDG